VTLRGSWAIGVLVALALSLAINFTVGGFFAARSVFGPDHPPPRGGFSGFLTAADRAFPPQMREALRDDLFNDPTVKANFDAFRAARQEMYAAMRADPYDPAALEAALDKIQASTSALQQAGHQALERIMAQTPADVRAEIGMHRRGRDGPRDGDRRGPPPRDGEPAPPPR